jgi:hypothetical protein
MPVRCWGVACACNVRQLRLVCQGLLLCVILLMFAVQRAVGYADHCE